MTMTKSMIADIEDPNPGAGTLYVHGKSQHLAPVNWEEIMKVCLVSVTTRTSADKVDPRGTVRALHA